MHSNMYIRKYFALALQNTQASTTKTGTAPAPAINRTEQKQKQTQYFQRYWVTIPVFSALYIYIHDFYCFLSSPILFPDVQVHTALQVPETNWIVFTLALLWVHYPYASSWLCLSLRFSADALSQHKPNC